MDNKDYIIIVILCVGAVFWMDYSHDKALNKAYHNDFKDREFNLMTSVDLPEGYDNGFMKYRKRVYNETWILSKGMPKRFT